MPLPDRHVIEEWFAFGQNDFECAEFLVDHAQFPHQAMVQLQQAAEKYLKGFLIARGWSLVKTHDLRSLIEEASKRDKRFARFTDMMKRLTERYVEQRYPGEALQEVTVEEARQRRAEVAELITLIRSLTP